jgi:predicted transcriptional regulator
MDIQERKSLLLKRLEAIEDINLIKAIDSILDYAASEEEYRNSIERYNKEIEAANSRIESGEYVSHDEVENESKSWLS